LSHVKIRREPGLSGIFFAAFSLRGPIVILGALLPEISSSLRLSHTMSGVAGALPVLLIGLCAPLATPATRLFGAQAVVSAGLALITIASLLRAFSNGAATLLASTAAIGLGLAVATTALPGVVKSAFARRRSMVATALYTCGMQVGSVSAAAFAPVLAQALGGWRWSLLTLALVGTGATAWWMRTRPVAPSAHSRTARERHGLRSAPLWTLAATFGIFCFVYYGLVTWLPSVYAERGWSEVGAAQLVAVMNGASLAGAIGITVLGSRLGKPLSTAFVLAAVFAAGAAGFAALPAAAAGWAVLVGVANGALLPVMLNMPVDMSHNALGATARTAVMNGLGYSMAALAPLTLGVVRDHTNSFHAGLLVTTAGGIALVVALAGRLLVEQRKLGTARTSRPAIGSL
jgi:CP family cyanate transporter-like MFS transporter